MDGYIARRCNKISQLGDILDHFSDFCSCVILLYFLYPLETLDIIILLSLSVMMFIHLGNQQIQYSKSKKGKEKESLDNFKKISQVVQIPIEISRYFGCGTINFVIIFIFMKRYNLY